MQNSVVNFDEQFSASELRSILKNILNIDCVLPCFMHGDRGSTAHCILPVNPNEEVAYNATWRDHILCKVLKKVPRRDTDGNRATQSMSVSSVKVKNKRFMLIIC